MSGPRASVMMQEKQGTILALMKFERKLKRKVSLSKIRKAVLELEEINVHRKTSKRIKNKI